MPSNTSLITPTTCTIFIHDIYLLYLYYMFRQTTHHRQGEPKWPTQNYLLSCGYQLWLVQLERNLIYNSARYGIFQNSSLPCSKQLRLLTSLLSHINSVHSPFYFLKVPLYIWDHGSAVAKVLCYKSEGRWFDPSHSVSGFFIDIKSLRSHYGPGIDSASDRNEYQEYFLGVKAAGA